MNRLLTIAHRELVSMFRVPAGWIIIALFAFLTAVLFVNMTVIPGQPGSLRYFFSYSSWLLIPIAPAISMRLISEEYRSGSFEALRTTPAGDWSVALGKYIGSAGFLILMLTPTLVYPLTLMLISSPAPDLGPIVSGYLMLVLVGALYLGIGLVASALTPSQTLAFLGTLMALILWMVLTALVAPKAGVTIGGVLGHLNLSSRISELSKGVIDTSTISFFVLGITWTLILTTGILEIRRLGKNKFTVGMLAACFVCATAASVFFAGVLTNRHHTRIDVTSTGNHQLSPRAERMSDRLTGPTELVLALDLSRADRRSVDLVVDVLEAYDRSSPNITARTIDLGSADAINQTNTLIAQLAARQAPQIEANTRAIRRASETLNSMGTAMTEIAGDLETVGSALDLNDPTAAANKGFFDQRAALMRVAARELIAQHTTIDNAFHTASNPGAPADLQPLAAPAGSTLGRMMSQLDELAGQLRAFADAETIDEYPRSISLPIILHLKRLRDEAAIAHEQIRSIKQIDAHRVARAIQTGEALLVIGAPEQGIAAVDLEAVLLPAAGIERAGGSAAGIIGPRTQELVASAIGQLVAPSQPILVLLHGYNPGDLLGSSGFFTRAIRELALKGIHTIEWAAVEDPIHPDLSMIDPGSQRPVVYMVIAVDSGASAGSDGLSGAKRATAMAGVVRTLVDRGQPVLVSLNPSVFPTFGDTDPIAQIAEEFGIRIDAGRTILHEQVGALGRVASPVTEVVQGQADEHAHPIADALHGLNTVLPWAVPMDLSTSDTANSWAIVTLPGADDTWGESRWTRLRNTNASARELLRDQPIYDPQADTHKPRWILGAAGEIREDDAARRMIVVGSNGWANDAVSYGAEQLVEGRVTRRYPGNAVLLESSIAWLAGMDDLIAPGADARPIATINPLTAKKLSALRWILLAGVPGLVLLIGMATRLVFG